MKEICSCVSETVKTGNSLKSDTVDTLKVVQNDSDTIETLDQLGLVR